MADAAAVEVRRLIESGLALYARGDVRRAADEWEQVRRIEPGNAEAAGLLDLVKGMIDVWPVEETTDRETTAQTHQRVRTAEAEAAEPRRPKLTVESPISALLATATRREPDTVRNDSSVAATILASEAVARARVELENGQFGEAAGAAEWALMEAEREPGGAAAQVVEAARALLTQVFAAHVGALGRIPVAVLSPMPPLPERETTLDERWKVLLSFADGVATCEQVVAAAGLSKFDGLRALSALSRAGTIRFL